tara:strand:- start:1751 stop:2215 length:465 start_codon:yes stop_codon:yes gene_type:complete
MFYPLDICIIQNCTDKEYLNGKLCIFLHKTNNNYIVACSDSKKMINLNIKNNNLKLDKEKNIEFIPGGSMKQIETRNSSIPLNIEDRVKNCKKYFKLHNECMLIYDKNNILVLGLKESFFADFAMNCWNYKNKIFNLYNVKKIYNNLIKINVSK